MQTFLERCEAKALLEASEVIGSVEQGDGDAKPIWHQSKSPAGKLYPDDDRSKRCARDSPRKVHSARNLCHYNISTVS